VVVRGGSWWFVVVRCRLSVVKSLLMEENHSMPLFMI